MELELGINSHDILTSRSYAWSNYSVYLPFFRSTKDHTLHIQSTDGNASASPFACSFNYNSCNGSLLAVADEEGHVKILDCSAPDIKYRLVSWRQHHNAIFDLLWSNNDTKIWTASGDQSIKCFDLDSSKDVMTISGFHSTSIKNISMRNDHEIASGGRDGQIIIIDSRQSKTPTAHFTKTQTTIKRKRLSNLKPHRSSIFQPESITGLQFISDYLLAASYAPSGDLALWDIRYSKSNTPHSILSYGNTCSSNHSLTSFICNSSGSIIYGTSTDHHVYTYSTVSNNSSQILQSLTTDAFSCKSFYVKSSISFDDRYLLTGSSLNGAIIWDLESLDAFQLMGHEGEVTSVAWCRHSHDLVRIMFI